ncbi:MAG: DUF2510 domain-containing protein [Actinomycetota bacterium]|nr:DUF2510 domain-containing protein [Actinomycetota bacterium]
MTEASPGWFPDSSQQGRLRWWDGKAWTDHYHDGPTTAAGPAPARGVRPGPPLAISILLLVLGVVTFGAGSIVFGVSLFRSVTTGNTMTVPGRARFHLSSGNYLIYERVATTSREGGGGDVSIDAGSVRITGPDGQTVTVSQNTGVTQTITRGSTAYQGAVEFKISGTGDYAFEVLNARPSQALVARSLGDTFRRALPWILIGGVGFVVGVAGLVMVIVGSVRRNRWSAGR